MDHFQTIERVLSVKVRTLLCFIIERSLLYYWEIFVILLRDLFSLLISHRVSWQYASYFYTSFLYILPVNMTSMYYQYILPVNMTNMYYQYILCLWFIVFNWKKSYLYVFQAWKLVITQRLVCWKSTDVVTRAKLLSGITKTACTMS